MPVPIGFHASGIIPLETVNARNAGGCGARTARDRHHLLEEWQAHRHARSGEQRSSRDHPALFWDPRYGSPLRAVKGVLCTSAVTSAGSVVPCFAAAASAPSRAHSSSGFWARPTAYSNKCWVEQVGNRWSLATNVSSSSAFAKGSPLGS